MERRDYLENQIEQLAQVLASMIGLLIGNKNTNFESAAEAVSQSLKDELGLSITNLLDIPDDTFIASLAAANKFNSENFEKLADILFVLAGQETDNAKAVKLYAKALLCYKYLEQNDKSYSLHRNEKIKKITEQVATL